MHLTLYSSYHLKKRKKMNLNKSWFLPKPPSGPTTQWIPVVRIGRLVPFGYTQDVDDPDLLQPVQNELELLERAKLLLTEYSSREVADWLSNNSGRYISHVGLIKRVNLERKRKQASSIARFYAKRYKEAIAKAEAVEAKIGGSATRGTSS